MLRSRCKPVLSREFSSRTSKIKTPLPPLGLLLPTSDLRLPFLGRALRALRSIGGTNREVGAHSWYQWERVYRQLFAIYHRPLASPQWRGNSGIIKTGWCVFKVIYIVLFISTSIKKHKKKKLFLNWIYSQSVVKSVESQKCGKVPELQEWPPNYNWKEKNFQTDRRYE